MCEIPIPIADSEKIVRAIVQGCVNKANTALKPRAFRSRPGADEVSVVRHDYKGSDFCKNNGRTGRSDYVGLAVLLADQIRKAGSEVIDSREEFCGHAHIAHGIIAPPPHEPLSAQENLALDKKVAALQSAARYHPDPDVSAEGWTGPAL